MRLTLQNVRLAFAKGLWEASNYKGQGEKKFKVKLILPTNHKQLPEIEKIFTQLAKEEWAANGPAVLKSLRGNPNKFCLIDGDHYPETEGMAGNMVLSVTSKVRPTVVARDGKTPVALEDGIVYSGCYVNALLEFRTMNHSEYGKGLFCTVRGVQFFADGDAFSGGAAPASEDEFTDLSAETADDPTA